MSKAYSGLTWDHPRGFNALDAAARGPAAEAGLSIHWDVQPLEGFESAPIAELCARYDLVVLDHPHVGEAVGAGCLQSLEEVFGAPDLTALEAETVGPCLSSYRFAGRHWALPLDAATQVMAVRPDLLDGEAPATWADVLDFADREGRTAASIAGPHAILSFFSICAALDEPPAVADPDWLVSDPVGREAYDILAHIAAHTPDQAKPLNPIGLLELMAAGDAVALCPLVYGYVTYTRPAPGRHALRFRNAPRVAEGPPVGTLGGTGIGVSSRCEPDEALKDHLRWLMSSEAQRRFFPDHDGQPGRREAWRDEAVNARWGGFYRDTLDTLEHSYVRPRHAGYIAFQTAASAMLREAFERKSPAGSVVAGLRDLYSQSRSGGER